MKKLLLTLMFAFEANVGWAIAYGVEDVNDLYPNVASVRGVRPNNASGGSCSGSLVARDAQKFVILTAGHCTDAWKSFLLSNAIQSVGVSFNQNNEVNGSKTNLTYFLRGGVPISNPAHIRSNQGTTDSDVGLVVFSNNAQDLNGATLDEKWPGLLPVNLPPYSGYIQAVVASFSDPKDLKATTVGYGTGEILAAPGENKGDSIRNPSNQETFQIRYYANNATFTNIKENGSVITFSINPAKDENGGCFGDSGGPIFYEDPSLGRVEITLNSYGDMNCRSFSSSPILDHPHNANFIACAFVTGDASAVQSCVDAL